MSFHPRSDLQTLFSLLDSDSSFHQERRKNPARRTFSPNFDVYETNSEFVLEGELPGLSDKSKVHIEFSDAQTLLIRGRIDSGHEDHPSNGQRSLKPTVEDEEKAEKAEKAAVTTTVPANGSHEAKKHDSRPKYWVSERNVGEFQRSFSFPGSVDVEKAKASLEHGILKVVVPKRTQSGLKRIEIQ